MTWNRWSKAFLMIIQDNADLMDTLFKRYNLMWGLLVDSSSSSPLPTVCIWTIGNVYDARLLLVRITSRCGNPWICGRDSYSGYEKLGKYSLKARTARDCWRIPHNIHTHGPGWRQMIRSLFHRTSQSVSHSHLLPPSCLPGSPSQRIFRCTTSMMTKKKNQTINSPPGITDRVLTLLIICVLRTIGTTRCCNFGNKK